MPKNEFVCDCNIVHEEHVAAAMAQMPDEDLIRRTAELYKMMGDPTRCRIICSLAGGEMCVCDICNVLSMSKSSVSHQLAKMRSGGIVKCRREGREVYYSLDDGHVLDILTTAMTHIKHTAGGKQ